MTQIKLRGSWPGPPPSEKPLITLRKCPKLRPLSQGSLREKSQAGAWGCSIRALPYPYNRNSCPGWERGPQAESRASPCPRAAFQPGRGCGLTPRRPVCGDRSPPGHQEARLLLSAFLGLECHPLESLSLRDAGSEWALESCRGLWCWGGRRSPHARLQGPW